MAHKFYFPTKDAWISSGSDESTNFGGDEILELKKSFDPSMYLQTSSRILVQFDYSDISKSVHSWHTDQTSGSFPNHASYSLKLYEAEASELTAEYTIMAHSISESWDEGVGKFGDDPPTTSSVSWKYQETHVSWSNPVDTGTGYRSSSDGTGVEMGGSGSNYLTGSGLFEGSQSFSYESPDINMDISMIVSASVADVGKSAGGANGPHHPNHGMMLKFSGSQEINGFESNDMIGDGTMRLLLQKQI